MNTYCNGLIEMLAKNLDKSIIASVTPTTHGITFAVVGSRSLTDEVLVHNLITAFFNKHTEFKPKRFVSGGAKGPDTFGEHWADKHNIEKHIIKPEWYKYGKRAGFIRNEDIIKECDVCLIFWDNVSKGTQHDIQLCKKLHKPMALWTPYFGNDGMLFTLNEDTSDMPLFRYAPLPGHVDTICNKPISTKYALVEPGVELGYKYFAPFGIIGDA